VPSTNTTCTLGFLYKDRKTGRSYMTTAGHCVLPASGQRTWPGAGGPVALDDAGKKIGTFVFAIIRDTKDFSLILIDRRVAAKAQVCHFGGPVGSNDDRRNDPAVLEFYGQAEAIGAVVPARSGVTANTRDPDLVYAQAPIALGDSGGPWLTDDGRALGYLTHILGYGGNGEAGIALLRRIGPPISAASKALGIRLTLANAPRIP
jgi:hypothetical protein